MCVRACMEASLGEGQCSPSTMWLRLGTKGPYLLRQFAGSNCCCFELYVLRSIYLFFIYFVCVFMCAIVLLWREPMWEVSVGSLLQPRGSWELNSGHRAWWQVQSSSAPSRQPRIQDSVHLSASLDPTKDLVLMLEALCQKVTVRSQPSNVGTVVSTLQRGGFPPVLQNLLNCVFLWGQPLPGVP